MLRYYFNDDLLKKKTQELIFRLPSLISISSQHSYGLKITIFEVNFNEFVKSIHITKLHLTPLYNKVYLFFKYNQTKAAFELLHLNLLDQLPQITFRIHYNFFISTKNI